MDVFRPSNCLRFEKWQLLRKLSFVRLTSTTPNFAPTNCAPREERFDLLGTGIRTDVEVFWRDTPKAISNTAADQKCLKCS